MEKLEQDTQVAMGASRPAVPVPGVPKLSKALEPLEAHCA